MVMYFLVWFVLGILRILSFFLSWFLDLFLLEEICIVFLNVVLKDSVRG